MKSAGITDTTDTPGKGTTSQPRYALMLVLAALIVAMANSTAAAPLYPLFQVQWGFSATMLTIIYAGYSGGVLVTLVSVGRLSDRLADRRKLIIPSLLVVAAGALWIAASSSVSGLIIGRLLSGMGTGALTGAASAALVELLPLTARRHGALFATTAITAGAALGPALCAVALSLSLVPTRLPFILTALAAAGVAIGLFRLPVALSPEAAPTLVTPGAVPASGTPESLAPHTTASLSAAAPESISGIAPARMTAISERRSLIVASAALALGWCAGGFAMTLAPSLAVSLFGVHERAVIALLLCLLQLIMGVSQVLSRHLSARKAMLAGTVLAGIALPLCAIATGLQWPPLFCLGLLIIGIGYGTTFVGSAGIVNEIAPAHQRARILSAFYVTGYAGSALPIMAFGALTDALGMLWAISLFSVVIVVTALLILRQAPHLPPQ